MSLWTLKTSVLLVEKPREDSSSCLSGTDAAAAACWAQSDGIWPLEAAAVSARPPRAAKRPSILWAATRWLGTP